MRVWPGLRPSRFSQMLSTPSQPGSAPSCASEALYSDWELGVGTRIGLTGQGAFLYCELVQLPATHLPLECFVVFNKLFRSFLGEWDVSTLRGQRGGKDCSYFRLLLSVAFLSKRLIRVICGGRQDWAMPI